MLLPVRDDLEYVKGCNLVLGGPAAMMMCVVYTHTKDETIVVVVAELDQPLSRLGA
jgi:hypothetical protein